MRSILVAALLGAAVLANAGTAAAYSCFDVTATIVGTNGSDRIHGTSGRDVIVGLGGDDVVWGARRFGPHLRKRGKRQAHRRPGRRPAGRGQRSKHPEGRVR
jgi:Ca2+-binding RTX toxin-like protein